MLTENNIVDYLENYFQGKGGKIICKSNTKQTGIDLQVEINGKTCWIEAKGASSSKTYTSRFGLPFTNNQITNHITRAILKTLKIQSKTDKRKSKYIIAFPSEDNHRKQLGLLRDRLAEINIEIYLVSKDKIEIL